MIYILASEEVLEKLSKITTFDVIAGKRRCPGEALAKNFLFLAFATLFHFYKISFPEGKEPSSKRPPAGILLTPQPYTVSLKARGEYDD